MTRARGYLDGYKPQAKTAALIDAVLDVLEEYAAQKPLTIRQIFYRLVGTIGYDKDEKAYARLSDLIVRARRARRIDFDDIRDDGLQGSRPNHWRDPASFIATYRWAAARAELDLLVTQPVYIEVLTEAAGMLPQMQRVADRYSVPVFSAGGFDSLTAKKAQAERICAEGKPTVVLHLGDYDPSGVSIFESLRQDVGAFLVADVPDVPVEFRRVALTGAQVAEMGLLTAPPKKSDSRSGGWVETCQLEAIAPDELGALVEKSIVEHLDLEALALRRSETTVFRKAVLASIKETA